MHDNERKRKGRGAREDAHGPINSSPVYNRGTASTLGFDDRGRPVAVSMPADADEGFELADVSARMTPAERLTNELRLAAVRTFLRIEPRSFEQIGRELGVTKAAVSRQYRALLERLGAGRDFDRALRRKGRQ